MKPDILLEHSSNDIMNFFTEAKENIGKNIWIVQPIYSVWVTVQVLQQLKIAYKSSTCSLWLKEMFPVISDLLLNIINTSVTVCCSKNYSFSISVLYSHRKTVILWFTSSCHPWATINPTPVPHLPSWSVIQCQP